MSQPTASNRSIKLAEARPAGAERIEPRAEAAPPPDGAARLEPYTAAERAESRRRSLRGVLLLGGPLLAALLGLLLWFGGGRWESTEDAYVKAEKVTLSAEVAGAITALAVRENQPVHAGDELLRIDDRTYRIALARAEAQLAAVVTTVAGIKASLRQKDEELALARTNRDFAEREFARQSELARRQLNSGAALDEARLKLDVARRQISVIEQEQAQFLSRLNGDRDLPAEQHPDYLAARADRDAAALAIERTVLRAPFDGIASKVPQRGQYLNAGAPVMSVIGTRRPWIEANYMETDLDRVRVGQPARITVDTYPGHQWQGKVASIAQATGAEFSVLPPQNASGNWVKIVQRIPVRIAIDSKPDDPVLRVGMTATVEIDTGRNRGLPRWLRLPGTDAAAGAR